jgi:hypothetical protein
MPGRADPDHIDAERAGFHSANAALALVMLTCGPITLHLPHEHHSP